MSDMGHSVEKDGPFESPHCNAVHEPTGARCYLEAGPHGPTHQGWAHYPGQLVTWPTRVTAPAEGDA